MAGGRGGIRTPDTRIKNPLFYPLNYASKRIRRQLFHARVRWSRVFEEDMSLIITFVLAGAERRNRTFDFLFFRQALYH